MPYKNISDLPDNVRNKLPKHAQEIFLKAFNNAWDEYSDPSKRRGGENESQEEICFKVAWSAVKAKYSKGNDELWHEK
ncbi:MAG: chaB [Rickettsiaceae bacterium]|jgi:cation transport regulator|nr:chaB [Rickettsiaceae bacterium]